MFSKYFSKPTLSLIAAGCISLMAVANSPVTPAGVKRPTQGLADRNIALWNSHGQYFNIDKNRWLWQRCHLHQTIEDTYTATYVLDLLMPMLENAGAYVMSPRERDTNEIEVIIDADSPLSAGYSERSGSMAWAATPDSIGGFKMPRRLLTDRQNPFKEGSMRQVTAATDGAKPSTAAYNAEIPEASTYSIYISYASLPESSSAVKYAVNSLRGREEFIVDQTMGGGTWIRLGEFPLAQGTQDRPIVEVSNICDKKNAGRIVTTDAVKIGGGIGNVARGREGGKATVSSYPRWAEGARYWLQWAGVPDSIYSPTDYTDDYTDDFTCRPMWVNYLAGGSRMLPDEPGLRIPVDLSFAFHTDAGNEADSTYVGTLGIYSTRGSATLGNGRSRSTNRVLAETVVSNITRTIRANHDANWVQRKLRDGKYAEARIPEVPSMLLELLSHQNFQDMMLGHDPQFRFDVARGVYKGILKYFAKIDGTKYTVQPLPVNSFAIRPSGKGKYLLTWQPTKDKLEATARPDDYIIEMRSGADQAFRRVAETSQPDYHFTAEPGKVYSFRIIARNAGGVSFPSEELSLGYSGRDDKREVLIVNGFTRISAPAWFDEGEERGFLDSEDYGVAYKRNVGYAGSQYDYTRAHPWVDDVKDPGYGASQTDFDGMPVAGNTFDYAELHGESILHSGHSFISASLQGYLADPSAYSNDIIDLILGKQRETRRSRDLARNAFKAFPAPLQKALRSHTDRGGDLLVSGEFIATDLYDNAFSTDSIFEIDKLFAAEVLGIEFGGTAKEANGKVSFIAPNLIAEYAAEPNPDFYPVATPDALQPSQRGSGKVIARFSGSNQAAAVSTEKNGSKVVAMSIPFETIDDPETRHQIMAALLTTSETTN